MGKLSYRVALLASAVLSAGAANAQSTAREEREIIVTAQKREEALAEVPQSITVVSGENLERQRAVTFQDYIGLIPGLSVDQSTPGAGRIILRGINTSSVSATVGVYVDEVPFGSSSGLVNGGILAADFDTFDIARIEVLRGPQGTLYGASSLGGVMKFVTRAPELGTLDVRARASIEDVAHGEMGYSGNLVVNVPLGDKAAVRATGYYRKDGGFIDSVGTAGSQVNDDINDSEVYGGRISALFEPTETLSIRVGAILQNIRANASSVVEADPVSYKPLYGGLTVSQFIPEFTNTDYRIYNGTLDWDLGFASLTSSTSYATLDRKLLVDNSLSLGALIELVFGTPAGVSSDQINEIRKFTQELRLASPESDTFEWMVGAYYTRETGYIQQDLDATTPLTNDNLPNVPRLADVSLDSKYQEYAIFTNETLHLGPRFDLTFGGRYSHNKQRAIQTGAGALIPNETLPTARSSDDVFTFSVAPRYEISDDVSVYARVARGYRPGGPNVLPFGAPPGTPTTYDADSLTSYEAGVKAQTPDRTFAIDFSAFYLDWKDIQLFARINTVGVNANGGTARSQGAEFNATLRPTDGVSLTITGAYTDAKLTADTDPIVGGHDGDRLPFTPKVSIALIGDYDFALGSTNAFVGGSVRLVGEQNGDFDAAYFDENGRQRELPSYVVTDLRAGVDFGNFSIEAFVKNLFDVHGVTSAGQVGLSPNGAITIGVVRPRTIGLSVGTEF